MYQQRTTSTRYRDDLTELIHQAVGTGYGFGFGAKVFSLIASSLASGPSGRRPRPLGW
jgi:hypothetical protein